MRPLVGTSLQPLIVDVLSARVVLPLVFLSGRFVADESNGEFYKALERGRLGEVGSPQTHRVDAGNEFSSAEFMKLSDEWRCW